MTRFRDTASQDVVIERAPLWRRHPRLTVAAAALVVVGALVVPILLRWTGVRNSVAQSRVVIGTVERGRFVRDVTADGRIVAAGSPMLYAVAAGTVTLQVHAGDRVTRGQVLATLDSPDLTAKLSQERSTLQSQQLEWRRAQLDAQRSTQRLDDAYSQAEVDQKTAQRELERSRKAYELGSYSELQALRSQDALDKANFALAQARANRDLQPEQNRFDVEGRQALAERQRLVVQDLERQVAALQVRSPVDGQVGQVQVAERASVARDAPLLSVVDLTSLEVEIKVPETLARDLASGMKAELTGSGGSWTASVSGVSPEVVAGQVTARLRFDDTQADRTSPALAALRQNQRLSVRILIDERPDVLSVPRGGFVDQDGGGFAYVVEDDVAVKRSVRLGTSSMSRVEVLDGLKAGERVVVSGTDAFKGADRVLISN